MTWGRVDGSMSSIELIGIDARSWFCLRVRTTSKNPDQVLETLDRLPVAKFILKILTDP